MWKGHIFSDWNGEVFTSICQTTDLIELNNSGVYSSFFRPELYLTLDKKWSFPLKISSVNVTKSAVSCGIGHIY